MTETPQEKVVRFDWPAFWARLVLMGLAVFVLFGLIGLILSLAGVGGIQAAINYQREINPNLPMFGVLWRVLDGPALMFVLTGLGCTTGLSPVLVIAAYTLQQRRQRKMV